MTFELNHTRSGVTVDEEEVGMYGYFSNDVQSLRDCVDRERTSLRVIYDCLTGVLGENYERRFLNHYGTFSYFYPVDKVCNENRY